MIYIVLTILKALIIIGAMIFLFKGIHKAENVNKLWFVFKIIGVAFLILLAIVCLEFLLATH